MHELKMIFYFIFENLECKLLPAPKMAQFCGARVGTRLQLSHLIGPSAGGGSGGGSQAVQYVRVVNAAGQSQTIQGMTKHKRSC